MNENQMMGALVGTKKALLEPTKPFKVTRILVAGETVLDVEETVWAHTYVIVDGCLQFIIMNSKEIPVQGEDGKPHIHTAVYQTFPKTFAVGEWRMVEEVFVPPVDANALAN